MPRYAEKDIVHRLFVLAALETGSHYDLTVKPELTPGATYSSKAILTGPTANASASNTITDGSDNGSWLDLGYFGHEAYISEPEPHASIKKINAVILHDGTFSMGGTKRTNDPEYYMREQPELNWERLRFMTLRGQD